MENRKGNQEELVLAAVAAVVVVVCVSVCVCNGGEVHVLWGEVIWDVGRGF